MIHIENVEKLRVQLSNGIELVMPCKGKLWSYLEFHDRIIFVVNIYDRENCNQYRNLFCYSKTDGSLLWQVEQAYDPDTKELVDGVYKYIGLCVVGKDGKYLSLEENGSEVIKHQCADGSEVIGQVYLKPFRYGIDKLDTMTWAEFSNEYYVDYETGKVEWFNYCYKDMPLPRDE